MQTFNTIVDLQSALSLHRKNGQSIALVPTMGNLHDGHLSLVDIANGCADVVVVSIFVNPTQFGAGEDFDSYPRTLQADCDKLQAAGVEVVFAPSVGQMYPVYPPSVQVLSGDVAKILCGNARPTHFDGVGLVVSKLFNIVKPDVAVFGKKDYQQLAIIRQLVSELNFDVNIIGGEIVRADDGLALSSRNQYLTDDERAVAPKLYGFLKEMAQKTKNGCDDFGKLEEDYSERLCRAGFLVDYLQVLTDTLAKPGKSDKSLVILTASKLGKTRLIDNIEINIT